MLRIANVGIQLLQIVGDTVTFYRMTRRPVLSCLLAQTGLGDLQGVGVTVGDEGGARGEDPRRNAVRQRRRVGVNDRVLNGVQRQAWLAGRPWLSAGQHQPVSRLTGADGALRREGGDPDTLRQLRRRRIETVVRVAQRVAAPRYGSGADGRQTPPRAARWSGRRAEMTLACRRSQNPPPDVRR